MLVPILKQWKEKSLFCSSVVKPNCFLSVALRNIVLLRQEANCHTVIDGGTQPPKAFSISTATASVKWSWFRDATAWKEK